MRSFLLLTLLCGCTDPIDDALPGHLAQVSIARVRDECSLQRVTGDGGVQFIGVREDGGLAFTVGQQELYGPLLDAGVLESVQRQAIPTTNRGMSTVGNESDCTGTFSAWVLDAPNVLRNLQSFPGRDLCTSGPEWLPSTACTVERVFTFTPISECTANCLRVTTAGEVSCGC